MIPYQKRFRYFIRLDANGQPVEGSLIRRKKKPSGRFIDITAGINFCCNAEYGSGGDITLAAPENVIGTPGGDGEIILSWDPVENATGYDIYVDGNLVDHTSSTGIILDGLISGQSYAIEVVATRGSLESDPTGVDAIAGDGGAGSTTTTTTSTSTSTTTAAPITVQWMSQASDPNATLIANSDPFTYTGSATLASTSSNIVIDVHDVIAYPDNDFFVIKVPSTVTDKTVWADDPTNAPFNNGVIPDSVFRAMVSFGGYDYYYTRVGQIWDHTSTSRVTLS